MNKYYVNKTAQPNGDHEVHEDSCYWLSLANSKEYLGTHSNCDSAVKEAKKKYPTANGCMSCSKECHTK